MSKGEITCTIDLANWKNQINKSAADKRKALDNTIRTVGKRLYKKIVDYTPVGDPSLWEYPHAPAGYVPGSLKAAWTISEEAGYTVIQNPLPYALRVEYGWSTQAPEGMMRRAIEEYPILVKRAATEFKL